METKFIKKLGFLFLLIAAFIINSGMAQSFDKGDDIKAVIKKERERIKRSKLKSETLWLYQVISGGTEENGVKVLFRKFDHSGNTLEQTSFKQDGGLLQKLTHTYNSIGNATESFSSKPGGIGNTKTIFNYDSDNNLVETIAYNSSGSVVMSMEYKYDNGGNMIEMIAATPDRSVYTKFSFKRNSDGNIIETNADRSISGKGITSSKIIFTYTSDGYKRGQISYDSGSRISQKTDYSYDSDGNLIEPEPTSCLLLASAVLLLRRRRKRR